MEGGTESGGACRSEGLGPGCPLLSSCLLLLPDKQSSSASLETLLALLQAEGAKIEEDTEVKPARVGAVPQAAVPGVWATLGACGPVPPRPGGSNGSGAQATGAHRGASPCRSRGCLWPTYHLL